MSTQSPGQPTRRPDRPTSARSSRTWSWTTAQIIVLGGLIEDKLHRQRSRRCRCSATSPTSARCSAARTAPASKTNLMVFLRPVVMRDAAAADRISLDRYDLIRAQQKDAQPRRPHRCCRSTSRRCCRRCRPEAARRSRRRDRSATPRRRRRPPCPPPPAWAPPRQLTGQRHGRTPSPALRLRQGAHRCCSRTTASSCVLWAAETRRLTALCEVLRLYDVDALRARGRGHAGAAHRRRPTPAANRAPRW